MDKNTLSKNQFIERATEIHNNKYDYSSVEYINSYTKTCILCPVHGKFNQRPLDHLKGIGCPKCGLKVLTTATFISQAIDVHGDKYNYSKAEYTKCNVKVKIICSIHGEFGQIPSQHLKGHGCKICGNIQGGQQKTLTQEAFIKRVSKIHNNKYDYSYVHYIKSNTKVCIVCPIHGKFNQTPGEHLKGSGCLKCGVQAPTTAQFIQRATKIHNNKYDYSNVEYINSYTKIRVICNIHGEFLQAPPDHLGGAGCPTCGNIQKGQHKRLTVETFISRATNIHNNKYDYTNIIYNTVNTPITIMCPVHGEFTQRAGDHLNGCGCQKCAVINRMLTVWERFGVKYILQSDEVKRKITQTCWNNYDVEHPAQKHMVDILPLIGDFNWLYDQYINQNKTSVQIANELGVAWSTVCNYLRQHEIEIRNIRSFSQISIHWLESITQQEGIFIQHAGNIGEYQIPGTRYSVDGYCKETNTCYEFHGDIWHGNPITQQPNQLCNPYSQLTSSELYQKTLEREELIKSLGYNLVVMWENDWNTNYFP